MKQCTTQLSAICLAALECGFPSSRRRWRVSSPAMAAAVSQSGGLGSLGIGAMTVEQARAAIRQFGARADGPLSVNVFVHRPAKADAGRESAWLERLAPEFRRWGAAEPTHLREIYPPFSTIPTCWICSSPKGPEWSAFTSGYPCPRRLKRCVAQVQYCWRRRPILKRPERLKPPVSMRSWPKALGSWGSSRRIRSGRER